MQILDPQSSRSEAALGSNPESVTHKKVSSDGDIAMNKSLKKAPRTAGVPLCINILYERIINTTKDSTEREDE